jgi:hypothetical protein
MAALNLVSSTVSVFFFPIRNTVNLGALTTGFKNEAAFTKKNTQNKIQSRKNEAR